MKKLCLSALAVLMTGALMSVCAKSEAAGSGKKALAYDAIRSFRRFKINNPADH